MDTTTIKGLGHLTQNNDDAVPADPMACLPGERRHFDSNKRIHDLPHSAVKHTHNIHKQIVHVMVVRSMIRSEVMANPTAKGAVEFERCQR